MTWHKIIQTKKSIGVASVIAAMGNQHSQRTAMKTHCHSLARKAWGGTTCKIIVGNRQVGKKNSRQAKPILGQNLVFIGRELPKVDNT